MQNGNDWLINCYLVEFDHSCYSIILLIKRGRTRSYRLWKYGWMKFWKMIQVDSKQQWSAPFRSFTKVGTNKTKTLDQRPVVSLNSVYELLNYVINEQLNVNPATILEPGKGERQARTLRQHYHAKRCTSSNRKLGDRAREFIGSTLTLKKPWTPYLIQRSGRWWGCLKFLLEQTYEGATVRLAPNNEEGATITFSTGVAQGSITSPQLFNVFINALLRMLTVTGQNEDISHGLQIGKDQKRQPTRWKWLSIQQHRFHRRYFNLCWHTRGHAKAAKRCAGIYGLVWNANQCEENVFAGNR